MHYRIPHHAPRNWLARLVGAVVGVIVLVGLFFIGLTVFAVAAGLAFVVFAIAAVRLWWMRRQWRANARRTSQGRRSTDSRGVVIEGEYEERRDR